MTHLTFKERRIANIRRRLYKLAHFPDYSLTDPVFGEEMIFDMLFGILWDLDKLKYNKKYDRVFNLVTAKFIEELDKAINAIEAKGKYPVAKMCFGEEVLYSIAEELENE